MKFKYSALNQSGRSESGFIDADGESSARSEIRKRGLYVVSLSEVAERQREKAALFSFGLRHRLPIQVARQLSSLLKGGVPLFQALAIMANQLANAKEREIVRSLMDRVKEGSSFSDALKAYPRIFDELFIHSVQAGEKSGALDSILSHQAELLESRAVLRGRIRTAMMYPAIMASVGSGVLVFLMVYVVPMVMKIFERMHQQLPLPTRLLLGIANFVNDYLFLVILALCVLSFLFKRWITRSREAKNTWDRFLLHLPVFGNLYNMILVNRFTRIMATLLKSGVTMVQSMLVVSRTMKSPIASESILRMAAMIEQGSDLSAALRNSDVFPSYVADMVSVGESGGNVEEMLTHVSEYYEVNVNQKIATLTSMVEPAIILSMGAIVAFVLVSVLLPLFEMNKVLIK